MRFFVLCILVLAFTSPLFACGKKGSLEPPATAKKIDYPRTYPQ